MAGSSSKPDRQQKSLSRHNDTESQQISSGRRPIPWCELMAFIFCFLFIFTFVLGMGFYGILRSYLPVVRLQRLDISALPEMSGDGLVAADLAVVLNVTNGSGKTEFGYRFEKAIMAAAAGVELGSVKLPADMHLKRHETAEVVVHTLAKVDAAAGKELVESTGKRVLVMDVVVEAQIDFFFGGGKRSDGWSVEIVCDSIDQTAAIDNSAPICGTFPTTPLWLPYILGIVIIILLVFLVYFFFFLKKKKTS